MTQLFKLNYLGARFNDEGGEGEGQGQQIDYDALLKDPKFIQKVRESDPTYKQLQSQVTSFDQQLADLKKEKSKLEQQSKDQKFQGETLRKILGDDVTDEAEAFTRIQAWAEERYNPVLEKERGKLKDLEDKLNEYQEKERTYAKKDSFMKYAAEHKGVERGGEDLLFQQAQQYINLDETGQVVYTLPDGRRAADAEEFIDELLQVPPFNFFAARAQGAGGLNNGQPGGAQRMTKAEYRMKVATSTGKEQADLIRKAQSGEIKLVEG
ncbi:hypothetical protein HNO53_12955 [Billgrantia antri]|uniref:Uncharacterized protein n=1 Tax=Halomonas sulfidivorans TaxID=2733488 RepID=A0ABX7WGQ8_9GAMM|nr:hypothetical protein [Halomonas sulfidivorans]QTP59545.1 hypothetical protein HNO53_12955 [Halomonas sulfidivorans]